MNQTIAILAATFSAPNLLLVDTAVKGTALLVLAGFAAMLLRRDSAATRHLVWLLAIVALLAVPVMSATLPQWRVLPEWAGMSAESVVAPATLPLAPAPATAALESPQSEGPVESERPNVAYQPAVEPQETAPSLVIPKVVPVSRPWNWSWLGALPFIWVLGFGLLSVRLIAARLLLWSTERSGAVILSTRQVALGQAAQSSDDPIVIALQTACLQLGMRRPVTLLIHPERAIPVVWGILRCRLLLPVAARDWTPEQLQSVLLHELAHIKRRDTLVQLLTQVACALHWFNPLVWFAAWRLGVERERACDDLVLTSGVRPSAYAKHLLDVVTALSPTRWTQACGLAMARKSSLEGRLVAVLSEKLNRRRVSVALAAMALATAVGIAVPLAMLRAADDKPVTPVVGKDTIRETVKAVALVDPPKAQKAPDIPAAPAGSKVDPAMEQNLKWGEPVNGLRAAVVIRHLADKPKPGEPPDLFIAVQNVSDAPIRFNDTLAEEQPRMLDLKIDGEAMAGIGAKDPRHGDVLLQPKEVTFVLMYSGIPRELDGRTTGSLIAEGMLKNTHQSVVVELQIEKAPAGAWMGKLFTGDSTGAVAAGQPQPKEKEGRALLAMWQHHARLNGNFPGGLVGRLGEKVNEFIRNNTGDASGDPYAKKMAPLVPRLDATRDWTPAELVVLFDEIAAITPIPLETTLQEVMARTFKRGWALSPDVANAPWGDAQPNGLRMALLLQPQAAEHRLGTPLKARILFQNVGKNIVVFRTRTWHQVVHQAHDAKGAEIKVSSIQWLTIGRFMSYRLWPGEYAEVNSPGIGVGLELNEDDWQPIRVGSSIDAKVGDEVTITSGAVPLFDWNEKVPADGEAFWWLDFIKNHLAQDLPFPTDTEERRRLVYRAGMELFGTPLSSEEINSFVNDRGPDALESLAKRLSTRKDSSAATGSLTSGPTQFRVLDVDPNAAKKPRVTTGPGRYTLNENAAFVVSRRPFEGRLVNEASIQFISSDPDKPAPAQPYAITLPDAYTYVHTWAAASVRGETVLWVLQKEYRQKELKIVQELDQPTSFDFTDASLDKVLKPIMERHGIEIVLDREQLKAGNVATDANDITLKVSDVSLKNALKLLLEPKKLTYVIENDVLKITAKKDGNGSYPIRSKYDLQLYDVVHSYDFTNPAQVQETTFSDPGDVDKVPKPILEALRAELAVPAAPRRVIGPPAAEAKPKTKPPAAKPK